MSIYFLHYLQAKCAFLSQHLTPIKKKLRGFLHKTNTGYWQDYKNEVETTEDNKIIFF